MFAILSQRERECHTSLATCECVFTLYLGIQFGVIAKAAKHYLYHRALSSLYVSDSPSVYFSPLHIFLYIHSKCAVLPAAQSNNESLGVVSYVWYTHIPHNQVSLDFY